MLENKEKQELKYGFSDTISGLEWLEACDMLERSGSPRRRGGRMSSAQVTSAAYRSVRRRHYPDAPSRQQFSTTADYYDAALPLLMGCMHLDHPDNSWRYMRPMMVRQLMAHWFGH